MWKLFRHFIYLIVFPITSYFVFKFLIEFIFKCTNFINSDNLSFNIPFTIGTSLFIVLLLDTFEIVKMIKTYRYLRGRWNEYCFFPEEGKKRILDIQNTTGIVLIKYKEDNLLSIELNETTGDKRTWTGNILMSKDLIKTGEIIWKYEPLKVNEHYFGLKKILVDADADFDYVYLMSINTGEERDIRKNEGNSEKPFILEPGYGKVVLRRKRKKGF